VPDSVETFDDDDAAAASSSSSSTAALFGKHTRIKTWVQGRTLITVRTGDLGYARVVVRRVTGTVAWLMKIDRVGVISLACLRQHFYL
jgi:hypothetical protein